MSKYDHIGKNLVAMYSPDGGLSGGCGLGQKKKIVILA